MKLLMSSKLNTTQALEAMKEMIANGEAGEHVKYLVEFVERSERGVIK